MLRSGGVLRAECVSDGVPEGEEDAAGAGAVVGPGAGAAADAGPGGDGGGL